MFYGQVIFMIFHYTMLNNMRLIVFIIIPINYIMLISFVEIDNILKSKNIKISGVFHIGAHECEEL